MERVKNGLGGNVVYKVWKNGFTLKEIPLKIPINVSTSPSETKNSAWRGFTSYEENGEAIRYAEYEQEVWLIYKFIAIG